MDKKYVDYYKRSIFRRYWSKRGSAPTFDSPGRTASFNLNNSLSINQDATINDITINPELAKTPTPSEKIFISYIRNPLEDKNLMNDSYHSQFTTSLPGTFAKHASVDYGDRSTAYDMFSSTKGINESFKGTSMQNFLESQNQSILEEPVQIDTKVDSKNITYNNGFSETTSKLTALKKKKVIKHEALKVPTKKDEKMFAEENASVFINKIKLSMNKKDNKVANDILKRFENKENGKRCIGKLGIAPVEYTKPCPKFANLYSKAIENTIFELTHNLKKELESKNMETMIKPKKEIPPEERPFLFELGLNMDDFVKRRGKKYIMSYVRETDDKIWNIVTKNPEKINDQIKYAGDEKLKDIYHHIKMEEKARAQAVRDLEKERENEKNATFLSSASSFNKAKANQRKARTIFGYQYHDDKTSNYLVSDTEKFLEGLKNLKKRARFGPDSHRNTIHT